jgi:fatty acid desaturase
MRPRFLDLAVHLARLAATMLTVAIAARAPSNLLTLAGAALLFLEAFAFMHDLAHGALLLPRRANEIALALAGGMLLMSGHALRRMHLIHHARTLTADDVEGLPARGSFLRALAGGPRATVALRLHAFRGAGRRGRRWQALETAAGVAAGAAFLASGRVPLVIYALVAIAAQATMSVWAAHVPHNAPAWLTGLAARFAWTGSPTMLSLAYHELHHARPEVPCRHLDTAAHAG